MVSIPLPQAPADSRQLPRSIDENGIVQFGQVGFQEIDFVARFGAKVTSTSQNDISVGTKIFTSDQDASKFRVGDDIQVTCLDDPDCYMYGTLVANDDTTSPSQLTVVINETSPLTCTSSNWELQVVARPKAWLEVDISSTGIDPTGDGPFIMVVTAGKLFPIGGSVLLRSIETPTIVILTSIVEYSSTKLRLKKLATTASVSETISSWDVALIDGPPPGIAPEQVNGLQATLNASDSSHDLDIAAGSVRDSTDTIDIILPAGITKRVDALWVSGTNQGAQWIFTPQGTVTSSGLTVTGSGTSFLTYFTDAVDGVARSVIGKSGGPFVGVDEVASDTSLTTFANLSASSEPSRIGGYASVGRVRYGLYLYRTSSDGVETVDAFMTTPKADGTPTLPGGVGANQYYRLTHYITLNDGVIESIESAILPAIATQMSITSDIDGLKLDGDEDAPGADMVYGTDGSGTKGWKSDPTTDTGTALQELQLALADANGAAVFIGGNSVADSFDALTYVNTAGATNLDPGTAGKLRPTVVSATVAYTDAASSTTDATSYTFTNMAAGTASSDRILVVALLMRSATAGALTFDTVTIGGVTATMLGSSGNATTEILGIFGAAVPTGTTATVVASFTGGNASRCACHMYRTTGATNSATATATDTSTPLDLSLNVEGGGIVIGAASNSATGPGGITWTAGLTEDNETTVESNTKLSTASAAFATGQTPATVTGTIAATVTTVRSVSVSMPSLGIANNMTVASTAFTASSAPSTGTLIAQIEEVDSITLNTDLIFSMSRDDGAHWEDAVMSEVFTDGAGVMLIQSAAIDLSGQTSDTDVKWQAETPTGKLLDIDGVYMSWS